MSKTVTASEAREKFFKLMDYVSASPEETVVVRRRNRPTGMVLVSEERLARLEAVARKLEGEAQEEEPFDFFGSIKLLVSPEELEEDIREMRREQEKLFEEKFKDL